MSGEWCMEQIGHRIHNYAQQRRTSFNVFREVLMFACNIKLMQSYYKQLDWWMLSIDYQLFEVNNVVIFYFKWFNRNMYTFQQSIELQIQRIFNEYLKWRQWSLINSKLPKTTSPMCGIRVAPFDRKSIIVDSRSSFVFVDKLDFRTFWLK